MNVKRGKANSLAGIRLLFLLSDLCGCSCMEIKDENLHGIV